MTTLINGLKPSEHIRRGLTMITETEETFLCYDGAHLDVPIVGPCGCALGSGAVSAVGLFNALKVTCGDDMIYQYAELFGLPHEIAYEVNSLHLHRKISARKIADWLEQAGY